MMQAMTPRHQALTLLVSLRGEVFQDWMREIRLKKGKKRAKAWEHLNNAVRYVQQQRSELR